MSGNSGAGNEEEVSEHGGSGEAQEGAQGQPAAEAQKVDLTEVNEQVFEQLVLEEEMWKEVQAGWNLFLSMAESKEAAGEAIYGALFEASPMLQGFFKTPRAVMALRFMNGISGIIMTLHDPAALKILVETLGFGHLDIEVTSPRVALFREAIIELLAMELGSKLTTLARDGFSLVLNYVGGAFIYIRTRYTDRIRIVASSWATANHKKEDQDLVAEDSAWEQGSAEARASSENKIATTTEAGKDPKDGMRKGKGTKVPTSFAEMFQFNAAVMGFGNSKWMQEILDSFDAIVLNVANSYRLSEECDVLSLRLSKHRGPINLAEFKAVMMASLRSLVPKDWDSDHEVAWTWLWENVERMLKALMGKPVFWETALTRLVTSLDEETSLRIKASIYEVFFADTPAGQQWFKQSTTRLRFIADSVIRMTVDMYKDPRAMVEDISALGLRHVGYGIPTELFGPFVSCCCKVMGMYSSDADALQAFSWSLSLVSRILVRTINEGSTVVMKAINANSDRMLRRAVTAAPRSKRATWVLNITVGTQSISPLYWAIESGAISAAAAIIEDLLVIRADRDRYYYGVDELFTRHPDIIKRLCADAPSLLPILFKGLIWRSRVVVNGMRRVNYYVKHLIVDAKGNFAPAIPWVVDAGDPKIICEPVLILVADTVWTNVVFRKFIANKWFFFIRAWVLIIAQAVVTNLPLPVPLAARCLLFALRLFMYSVNGGRIIYYLIADSYRDYKNWDVIYVFGVPIPEHFENWVDCVEVVVLICLIVMLCTCPILYCFFDKSDQSTWVQAGAVTQYCPDGIALRQYYNIFSLIAVLLYMILHLDLTILSTQLSAYLLVALKVAHEVVMFVMAVIFVLFAFSCAICALDQSNPRFGTIPTGALSLGKMTLGMFGGTSFKELTQDPVLLAVVFAYMIITVVFLLNLLVAQLNCAYSQLFGDMVGHARLSRAQVVTTVMPTISKWRWDHFLDVLKLDERREFNEGDIGLPGAIQVEEPATLHVTTQDQIFRFGGSTSPTLPWPEDEAALNTGESGFDKLEKTLLRAMKSISSREKKARKGAGSSSMASGTSGMGSSSMAGTAIEKDGSVDE